MPEVDKGTFLEFFSSMFGNWTANGIHHAEDDRRTTHQLGVSKTRNSGITELRNKQKLNPRET